MGKLIVPVDGSKLSMEALKVAISMVEHNDDQLLILNIQTSHQALGLVAITEAEALLKQSNVKYETKIRLGFPSVEIISEAKNPDVKFIVMGKRGEGAGGTEAKKLGSVGNAVLDLAPCPVVIVPKIKS